MNDEEFNKMITVLIQQSTENCKSYIQSDRCRNCLQNVGDDKKDRVICALN